MLKTIIKGICVFINGTYLIITHIPDAYKSASEAWDEIILKK